MFVVSCGGWGGWGTLNFWNRGMLNMKELAVQRLLSQLEQGRRKPGDATTKPECRPLLSQPQLALRQWVAGLVTFLPSDSWGRRQEGCSSHVFGKGFYLGHFHTHILSSCLTLHFLWSHHFLSGIILGSSGDITVLAECASLVIYWTVELKGNFEF